MARTPSTEDAIGAVASTKVKRAARKDRPLLVVYQVMDDTGNDVTASCMLNIIHATRDAHEVLDAIGSTAAKYTRVNFSK